MFISFKQTNQFYLLQHTTFNSTYLEYLHAFPSEIDKYDRDIKSEDVFEMLSGNPVHDIKIETQDINEVLYRKLTFKIHLKMKNKDKIFACLISNKQ